MSLTEVLIKQKSKVEEIIAEHREVKKPIEHLYHGKTYSVFPNVFSPFIAPSGSLSFSLAAQPNLFTNLDIADIGCGSGIFACLAAQSGARSIVGIDINPDAIVNSKENAQRANVSKLTDFRLGDVYSAIQTGEKFDLIFADLPFTSGNPRNMLETAFYDPYLNSIKDYIHDLPRYLSSINSKAFLCVSNLEDIPYEKWAIGIDFTSSIYLEVNFPWVTLQIVQLQSRLSTVQFP